MSVLVIPPRLPRHPMHNVIIPFPSENGSYDIADRVWNVQEPEDDYLEAVGWRGKCLLDGDVENVQASEGDRGEVDS